MKDQSRLRVHHLGDLAELLQPSKDRLRAVADLDQAVDIGPAPVSGVIRSAGVSVERFRRRSREVGQPSPIAFGGLRVADVGVVATGRRPRRPEGRLRRRRRATAADPPPAIDRPAGRRVRALCRDRRDRRSCWISFGLAVPERPAARLRAAQLGVEFRSSSKPIDHGRVVLSGRAGLGAGVEDSSSSRSNDGAEPVGRPRTARAAGRGRSSRRRGGRGAD